MVCVCIEFDIGDVVVNVNEGVYIDNVIFDGGCKKGSLLFLLF